MLWSSTAVLVLGLAHLCVSSPLVKRWDDFAVKHEWLEIPKGWEYHSPAPLDHSLDLRIGLKQDKLDELINSLYEVSDPSHPRYGAHLSKEEVDALAAPHPDSVELVESWLLDHDVDPASAIHRSGGGEWIVIRVPVAAAERLLNTKYNVYYNPSTSSYVVRTLSYSLPRVLHSHVDVVTPTTYFGNMRKMKATSFLQPDVKPLSGDIEEGLITPIPGATVPESCSTTITPACLRALYNSSTYVPAATDVNILGVAGYLEEFANNADLQTFFRTFRPDAVGATFTTTLVNGGLANQNEPGVEANLDIQYTEGISFPTPNIYYSTGGSPPFTPDSNTPTNTNEPYLDWLNFILAETTIPQTFTTSYGDDEQTVPEDYAVSVCNLFAQLGLRGSSIMFSSGDDGVGGGTCVTNDGTLTVQFQPNFPASCPFVTTVGGTFKVPEVAVSFSGGGFSNYFAQPLYQTAAVTTFLDTLGNKFNGLFNKTGRAYPDVAAQGEGFQVVIGGRTGSVAGTSCSSPTFAGIVSLLNDFRIASGKSPLGFLNPLIYSTAAPGFNDITSGSNPGCGEAGFTAGEGWDPVTGFGTPDFGKLQAIVANV